MLLSLHFAKELMKSDGDSYHVYFEQYGSQIYPFYLVFPFNYLTIKLNVFILFILNPIEYCCISQTQ